MQKMISVASYHSQFGKSRIVSGLKTKFHISFKGLAKWSRSLTWKEDQRPGSLTNATFAAKLSIQGTTVLLSWWEHKSQMVCKAWSQKNRSKTGKLVVQKDPRNATIRCPLRRWPPPASQPQCWAFRTICKTLARDFTMLKFMSYFVFVKKNNLDLYATSFFSICILSPKEDQLL